MTADAGPEHVHRGRGRWLGLAALFSGVALLLNILADVSLPLALAVTGVAGLILATRLLRAASRRQRTILARSVAVAAVAGFVATLTYDVSRSALSVLDPSPFNPFEAIRQFGGLIAGPTADASVVLAVGTVYHLLNGISFGVAYTLLFGRAGATTVRFAAVSGMAWGLFLEIFQLTLYPGWLDIRFYQEFATISAASHLVYGLTLGLVARRLLRRIVLRERAGAVGPGNAS